MYYGLFSYKRKKNLRLGPWITYCFLIQRNGSEVARASLQEHGFYTFWLQLHTCYTFFILCDDSYTLLTKIAKN